ncbi:MAG: glycerophosphodiester phosphodiesterase [Janthinobacterium lividum]
MIAHRGYSMAAPENTLAAFEAALVAGADLLELDVHVDGDGVPVVIHDDTLDRTTDATGPVAAFSSRQLRAVDAGSWFSPDFAGQRVPTLREVVDLTARYPGVGLLVEFKGRWSPDQVAVAVQVIRDGGIAEVSLLQSFDRATVASLREVAPDVRRGLLVLAPGPVVPHEELPAAFRAVAHDPFGALVSAVGAALAQAEQARAALGVVTVNPYVAAIAARPEVVAEYHAAGVQTMPYTVDDPQLWRELLVAGVDAIITNDPGRLRGYLTAREHRRDQDGPALERADLTRLAVRQGRMPERVPA